ncbi:hypothetical protein J6590_013937 [Homalodisca vitripennis]|nr:hypothetical protein J6590_013937 [Homalodisca vitripennis]
MHVTEISDAKETLALAQRRGNFGPVGLPDLARFAPPGSRSTQDHVSRGLGGFIDQYQANRVALYSLPGRRSASREVFYISISTSGVICFRLWRGERRVYRISHQSESEHRARSREIIVDDSPPSPLPLIVTLADYPPPPPMGLPDRREREQFISRTPFSV